MTPQEVQKKLDEARERARKRYPFYAAILLRLRFVDRSAHIPGLSCPDPHWRVYYNSQYVEQKTVRELAGLLLTDTILIHSCQGERRRNRHPFIWTLACLLEAGSDLVDDPLVGLPTECVYPGFYGFEGGLTAEQYYNELRKLPEIPLPFRRFDEHGEEIFSDEKFCFSEEPMPLMPTSELLGFEMPWELGEPKAGEFMVEPLLFSSVRRDVEHKFRDYCQGGPGNVPDYLLRKVKAGQSQVRWESELCSLIAQSVQRGSGGMLVSFTIPNPLAMVIPGTIKLPWYELIGPQVLIVLDTSGSMSVENYTFALGEVDGVLSALGPTDGISVMPCDADAKPVQNVLSGSQVNLIGGGGTDMGVALVQVDKLEMNRPDAVIVMTYGITKWPKKRPTELEIIILNVSREWPRTGKKHWPAPAWAHLIEMFPDTSASLRGR